MLEELLTKFGVFGLWTASNLSLIWYLLKNSKEDKKETLEVVKNNTTALTLLETRINSLK
jgi:hypothetical protein